MMKDRGGRKVVDQSILHTPPTHDEPIETGHYVTQINEVEFEYIYVKGTTDWLYVFLSPTASKYSRWSYSEVTDAHVICLLDPMIAKYGSGFWGYFFGTETEDYREYLVEIIRRFTVKNGIPAKHTVFYSSSNGGTAALFCADLFEGSVAVAINPQFDVASRQYRAFKRRTGLDVYNEKYIGRTNVGHAICSNKKSTFILIINEGCGMDLASFSRFCNDAGVTYKYGLSKKENIISWIYCGETFVDRHVAVDNRIIFSAIHFLIDYLSKNNEIDEIEDVFKTITLMWDYSFEQRNAIYLSGLEPISDNEKIKDAVNRCIDLGKVKNADPRIIEYINKIKMLHTDLYETLIAEKSQKEIEDLRIAVENGDTFAQARSMNLVFKQENSEYLQQATHIVSKLAEAGNVNAMGFLGRAYRDGKGVGKNLETAAYWMRKAADKKLGWAKNELFDILWRINTPESLKEAYDVAFNFAKEGDGNAMGRLGRMYRDGKYVEKNLILATEWMNKAVEKNKKWNSEFLDLFSRNDCSEDRGKATPLCKFLEKDDDLSTMRGLNHAPSATEYGAAELGPKTKFSNEAAGDDKSSTNKHKKHSSKINSSGSSDGTMDTMDKKIVLYNVRHYGYFSSMLLHNAIFNKDERAYLLIDSKRWSEETRAFMNSIQSIPLFEDYYVYDEGALRDVPDNDLENCIQQMFNNAMKEMGIEIDQVDEIYSGFDGLHAFGIFLSLCDKEHYLFDMSRNTSTTEDGILSKGGFYNTLLCKHKALTWDSPLVKGVIYMAGNSHEEVKCTLAANNIIYSSRPHADDKKDNSFFTINDNFKKLTAETVELFRLFFNIKDMGGAEYTVLLLNSNTILISTDYCDHSKKYNDVMTRGELFLYPFRILLDNIYVEINDLAIKSHPNTGIDPVLFNKIFPDVLHIPGYIPSELLFLYNMNIICGISPGSGSVSSLDAKTKLTLPQSFFGHFEKINKIVSLLSLSNYLGLNKVKICGSVPKNLITSLSRTISKKLVDASDKDASAICYHDENSLSSLKPDMSDVRIHAFPINEAPLNIIGDNYLILKLEKEKTDNYGVSGVPDEYVLIITRDEETLKQVKNFTGIKVMKYSGTKIKYSVMELSDCVNEFKTYDENNSVEYHANIGNVVSKKKLSNQYYKKGNIDDLHMAATLMRDVVNDGRISTAKNELIDILLKINTPDSLKEAYKTALEYSVKGDTDAMVKLGRMYKDGRGTNKDLDKATAWIEKAFEKNEKYMNDFVDVLLRSNDGENHKRAFKICRPVADMGDIDAMGRLGRMYRDGKGITKDISKAIELLERAYDRNNKWVLDLVDALLLSKNEKDHERAFNYCFSLIDIDDAGVMGRLGRMYRDGKGTRKDIDKAIQWMKKAADNGLEWAKKELAVISNDS